MIYSGRSSLSLREKLCEGKIAACQVGKAFLLKEPSLTLTHTMKVWLVITRALQALGEGPCTMEPFIRKLLMEKWEPGRLPEVPQSSTGTQPAHSEE